ncbi:MAG TPA: enoyl-ACP reductase, partial [Anaerolineae bacterium]|nr:enoyl-ACP reductase [Anaerolineae bacterium]
KKALIFGVANDHSIAWGIAQALHREGAELGFSYAMDTLERRVRPLAESLGSDFIEKCDVTSDAEIDEVFEKASQRFGTLDVLVHAIAFANREDLAGRFVNTSRDGFLLAHNISVYSLIGLARAAAPLMPEGGSVVTMTYYGAEKVVPKYNVMGVAKAALEASARYLAYDLGPKKIRVNCISAGPIRTLAASGVAGFRTMHGKVKDVAPLRRTLTIEDVGNAAVWLCSDLAAATTGEVLFVDGGLNVLALAASEEQGA